MSDVLDEYASIVKKTYPPGTIFYLDESKIKTVEDIVKVLQMKGLTRLSTTNFRHIEDCGAEHLFIPLEECED